VKGCQGEGVSECRGITVKVVFGLRGVTMKERKGEGVLV
jgi:hypothetical protein